MTKKDRIYRGERPNFHAYDLEILDSQIGVSLVVRCGSMQERECQKGFSHLLEHMNISFDKYCYNRNIKCLGYTDFFYTYYIFITDRKYIVECIQRINEIINGTYITKDVLEKIKPDVIEEYYKEAEKVNNEYKYLLEGTKYAEQFAIGNIDIITGCQYNELLKYYQKYYISINIEIILMGKKTIIKKHIPINSKKHSIDKIICKQYCISNFQWIKLGKKGMVKIFFLKKHHKEKEELVYDSIFLSLIKHIIFNIYEGKNAEVSKNVLSDIEEFICIDTDKTYLNSITEVKEFVKNIVSKASEDYISEFILIYKEEFFNNYKRGYGINLIQEMKQCIHSLIFNGEIIGSRELNDIIIQELRNIDINKIVEMISKMANNDADFFLYKIIEK